MPVIAERARAKVNLTLGVLGRRADGYHELESLVAFADIADAVTLDRQAPAAVTVTGPFAASIASRNLIEVTLERLRQAEPRLVIGRIALEKRLPVAAGIGGGSADAAAVLRAVRRANPDLAAHVDWQGLALRLGADVPVCLLDSAAWIRGAGELVEPLAQPLPQLHAVLCNPLVRVPDDKTAQVFRTLGAAKLFSGAHGGDRRPSAFQSRSEVTALMRERSNDLEAAASGVVPQISDVMEALRGQAGIEIARLSGAGPTCFGIFAGEAAAWGAAAALRAAQPGWWVEVACLG